MKTRQPPRAMGVRWPSWRITAERACHKKKRNEEVQVEIKGVEAPATEEEQGSAMQQEQHDKTRP